MDLPVNQILVGDCLEVMKGWPDNCVDLVLTDIPYNISQKSAGLRQLDYGEWDKQDGMETEWANLLMRVTGNAAIIWCADRQWCEIEKIFRDAGFLTRKLIWYKPNPTVINCDKLYIQATENAVYAKKRGGFYAPRYKHNVFQYPFPQKREHPTQKPLPLFRELVLDSTKPNQLILDPFCGSGTTCVAAKMLGRNYIGIDISEKYCEIARMRLKAVETGVSVSEQKIGQIPLFPVDK